MLLNILEFRALLLDSPAVLDVGCGNASPIQYLGIPNCTGIDGYQPAVDSARKAQTHHNLVVGDIRNLQSVFPKKSFDACIALDVIEHLSKEDGFRLIESMESVARKRVIFLTPNGFLPQRHQSRDDLQEHLSGWSAKEMAKRGFHVIGMLGPKNLRGEFHRINRRPRALWGLVSLFQQLTAIRQDPESAAAILCWKDLK
ncbi:MAG: class I SAM-dependent methyltransferase [Verrucomicrobia bacterium]|nr:class I SAM-dependent methyltransferase [Verrucomicrobiota bacterium]MBI3869135.1 class I SAM-dependent methyltransferase [Verrucomicrobiota bacterium]